MRYVFWDTFYAKQLFTQGIKACYWIKNFLEMSCLFSTSH
jgi:hypothetical protein